jgi:hypothetical protein
MHIVGLDEFGPMSPPTYTGGRYVLVIRDFYTHYNYAVIINRMTELLPALERFIARAENQHAIKLRNFHKNCMEHPSIKVGILRSTSHIAGEVVDFLKDPSTQPE